MTEREELARKVSAASSPQQLADLMSAYKELGGRQLYDLKLRYQAGTYNKRDDFDTKLSPEAQERLTAFADKLKDDNRNVYLEINASPERLDLGPAMIRTAKAKGCKFVISTDAHHPKHLPNMTYGVRMARRGWLGPSDILNTLPLAEFAKAIHAK